MARFTVYDGRANFDMDGASVLDIINAKNSKKAIKQFKKEYAGEDAVLTDNVSTIIHSTQWEENDV